MHLQRGTRLPRGIALLGEHVIVRLCHTSPCTSSTASNAYGYECSSRCKVTICDTAFLAPLASVCVRHRSCTLPHHSMHAHTRVHSACNSNADARFDGVSSTSATWLRLRHPSPLCAPPTRLTSTPSLQTFGLQLYALCAEVLSATAANDQVQV